MREGLPKIPTETPEIYERHEERVYDEADVERWKEGAEKFRSYFEQISALPNFQKFVEQEPGFLNKAKAVFLGVKPALLLRIPHALGVSEKHKAILEEAELKVAGSYVYSPTSIAQVIEQHQEVFKDFEAKDPDGVMQELSGFSLKETSVPRGILLGYPLRAVLEFDRYRDIIPNKLAFYKVVEKIIEDTSDPDEEDLLRQYVTRGKVVDQESFIKLVVRKLEERQEDFDISDENLPKLTGWLEYILDSRDVNVCGIRWNENKSSDESRTKQARIKAAFERSGILDIK